MSDQMRLFTAIELPEEIRSGLSRFSQSLARFLNCGRWVAEENLHVTFLFLGSVDACSVAEIAALMKKTAAEFQGWPCEVSGLGCFPNASVARVLWAGMAGGEDYFADLFAKLQESIGKFCAKIESRRFTPHVTLARFEKKPPRELAEAVEKNKDRVWGQARVEKVTLFESKLSPQGPQYTVVERVPLGK